MSSVPDIHDGFFLERSRLIHKQIRHAVYLGTGKQRTVQADPDLPAVCIRNSLKLFKFRAAHDLDRQDPDLFNFPG